MLKIIGALVLGAVAAFAQTAAPPAGSISGTVTDGAGKPVADVQVALGPNSAGETRTDSTGRYAFHDLAPRRYTIFAFAQRIWSRGYRVVTLAPGQDLASIDFRFPGRGEITGKVVDENDEPMPGIAVFLVAREYAFGALRYVFAELGKTGDKGEYRLQRADPGRAYLVLAENRAQKLDAISDAPADPKLRKRVVVPTYFPNSDTIDGAEPVTVRAGEPREGIDIHMTRSPSYCIEGILDAGSGPAALSFNIAMRQPANGYFGDSAVFVASPGGTTGPDGKVRVCDLHAGQYEITASRRPTAASSSQPLFGTASVTITDHDVTGLRLSARPRIPIDGEVVWDGTPPDQPVQANVTVSLRSRTGATGERPDAQSSVPGEFSFPGVSMDEYLVQTRGLSGSLYVKDITYGGTSVLHEPLRVGSSMGNAGLRVVVARDAFFVAARVVDKDGNAAPDAYVLVMPANAASEAMFAATLVFGQADQNGVWSSGALAPARYYVLASAAPVDFAPESIAKLWRALDRARLVDGAPNTMVQLTLVPAAID